jgi:hypothetical protein
MTKCMIYQNDYMLNWLRTKDEVIDLFGEDYFNEDWDDIVELDQSLIDEFLAVKKRLFELDTILQNALNNRR